MSEIPVGYIPGTRLTFVLIGKDHILGGFWSKIEVIGIYSNVEELFGCIGIGL